MALTTRQEKFCREYASCGVGTKATIAAGFADEDYGSELLKKPKIISRIRQLKGFTPDLQRRCAKGVLDKLWRETDGVTARDRLKALELLGRHYGLFVDRREVGKPGAFSSMSDAELEKRIRDLAKAAGDIELGVH